MRLDKQDEEESMGEIERKVNNDLNNFISNICI